MLIYASSCPDYFAEHGEAFVNSAQKHGHQVKVDITEGRVESSLLRFKKLPDMLDDDVLVLDIDSIINEPIKIPKCDMALFFRPGMPPWREELHILAGASFWTKRAKPFAEGVRDRLTDRWGSDQIALWRTFQEMPFRFDIHKLDQNFMSYDFRSNAAIWTAKGPRKSDKTYTARREIYAHQ